jgi:pilus assembly protein Flp/PilA
MLKRFLRDERGVTAIEYAVIAGMIFLAIVTAIGAVAGNVTGLFNTAASGMSGASGG